LRGICIHFRKRIVIPIIPRNRPLPNKVMIILFHGSIL